MSKRLEFILILIALVLAFSIIAITSGIFERHPGLTVVVAICSALGGIIGRLFSLAERKKS